MVGRAYVERTRFLIGLPSFLSGYFLALLGAPDFVPEEWDQSIRIGGAIGCAFGLGMLVWAGHEGTKIKKAAWEADALRWKEERNRRGNVSDGEGI